MSNVKTKYKNMKYEAKLATVSSEIHSQGCGKLHCIFMGCFAGCWFVVMSNEFVKLTNTSNTMNLWYPHIWIYRTLVGIFFLMCWEYFPCYFAIFLAHFKISLQFLKVPQNFDSIFRVSLDFRAFLLFPRKYFSPIDLGKFPWT